MCCTPAEAALSCCPDKRYVQDKICAPWNGTVVRAPPSPTAASRPSSSRCPPRPARTRESSASHHAMRYERRAQRAPNRRRPLLGKPAPSMAGRRSARQVHETETSVLLRRSRKKRPVRMVPTGLLPFPPPAERLRRRSVRAPGRRRLQSIARGESAAAGHFCKGHFT